MDEVADAAAGIAVGTDVQSFRERLPLPELHPYVTSVWIQHVPRNAAIYRHRTAPNGSAELICQPGHVPVLIGPQTGPGEQLVAPGTVTIGVRLRPGALNAVIGIPASELVDHSVPLDDLCGPRAVATGEAIADARSMAGAAGAIEAGVLALLTDDSLPDPAVAEAVRRL